MVKSSPSTQITLPSRGRRVGTVKLPNNNKVTLPGEQKGRWASSGEGRWASNGKGVWTDDRSKGGPSWSPSDSYPSDSYDERDAKRQRVPEQTKGRDGENSATEKSEKIRKTVLWYNKSGLLNKSIDYRAVAEPLNRLPQSKALGILGNLEECSATLENPTAWLIGALIRNGVMDEIDPDSRRELTEAIKGCNESGGMVEPISTFEVLGPLSKISIRQAMSILEELRDKKGSIKDPSRWIVGYARKMARESKIKKTAWWYNAHAKLKAPIQVDDILPSMMRLEEWQALACLKNLGDKSAEIRDPTAYLLVAATKWNKQDRERRAAHAASGQAYVKNVEPRPQSQ
eukprot:TRINITY_DN11984_c0_g1_i1.p1 TRINITY_DN11984_c0_g1~~TRINITY_DN11984_c0_g1_i1.p1  ORF type:complete len:371 (-),score=70.70 TRINITY_DN11984_c0_g1_i1:37-1068(-)